jgi:hypothetical protein
MNSLSLCVGGFGWRFATRTFWVEEGEFLIVPRGVEDLPVADEEVHILFLSRNVRSTPAAPQHDDYVAPHNEAQSRSRAPHF